ncbi:MAG: TetR/AcrR family transcriptional regulator [Pseudomonadota bacterium]
MRSVTRRSRAVDDEDQGKTVEHIVSAFERLLASGESFTTVSVDQLAKEAGIARATFYLHFRNKGELVCHLMQQVESEVRHAATASMARLERIGRADFVRFMRGGVEIFFQHRAAIRAMVETSAYDPDVAQAYRTFMQNLVADTRRVIGKLQATGHAHPGVTPEIAEIVTWAAERSCAQMLNDDDSPERRAQHAAMLTHVIWNAIAAPD